MLKYIIYYSAYAFTLYIILRLAMDRKRNLTDVLFLLGVSLLPIGKLFLIPGARLVSVKAGFIFTTIVACITMLLAFIRGVEKFAFVPFLIMLPVLLSILFLFEPLQDIFVSSEGEGAFGTPLLRVISILFTCIYCAYVLVYVAQNKNAKRDIAIYYTLATLFAIAIGMFITYGLFTGTVTRNDLMPVSVEDVHVAGRIFRFNPGASVNEFGEIIAYAIFMLRWTGWTPKQKMLAAGALLVAEFLSLTRGAWLGLVVGYLAYALSSSRKMRRRIYMGAGALVSLMLVVIASFPELRELLVTRTSIQRSAGTDDRIETAISALTALNDSPMRMLFGYGWSSDIFSPNLGFENLGYIHSVPLMFLFDTGLIGVTICIFIFYVFGRFVYANAREDRDIIAGMIAFMFTISLVEHVFFHVQTWLIFGLILGIALRNSRLPAAPLGAGRAEPRLAQ